MQCGPRVLHIRCTVLTTKHPREVSSALLYGAGSWLAETRPPPKRALGDIADLGLALGLFAAVLCLRIGACRDFVTSFLVMSARETVNDLLATLLFYGLIAPLAPQTHRGTE